ncbi:ElyC/SanA/YdcF family protein [Sphingomonas aerolata]|uniref:ElyC/SanA/YdcF family protein n=1 Tax=Sphingomonas aerolata TaxID=185951 RepID=UPI001ABA1439|nr:hypothetical protein [Sphingomonas aerolata]
MTGLRMILAVALAGSASVPLGAQGPAPAATGLIGAVGRSPDAPIDVLSQRLFPRLGALRTTPGWAQALDRDPAMRTLQAARTARRAACGIAAACTIEAAIWTIEDRAALVAILSGLAAKRGLPPLAANADLAPVAAIAAELDGLNAVLRVYGLGHPSRYPAIDGPVFTPGVPYFADGIAVGIEFARAASGAAPDTLDGSVALALALLDGNDATAATLFEPLDDRENAGARTAAARTDWAAFRYTALIVPGVGPEDSATRLSPRSKLHALLAAQRYRQGLAPFILVSGSAVHPRGTRFVEAVEIRRALIERYAIPADRIILEPYARHTTTNLRNATRRMAALGIALDRPTLIVTDAQQSAYIESPTFTTRNTAELGYMPGTIGRRLSVYDLEFRPSRQSLRQDPRDPLDP